MALWSIGFNLSSIVGGEEVERLQGVFLGEYQGGVRRGDGRKPPPLPLVLDLSRIKYWRTVL